MKLAGITCYLMKKPYGSRKGIDNTVQMMLQLLPKKEVV